MAGRLAGTVIVRHPGTSQLLVLQAGDDVPVWAADQITNPKLWDDEEQSSSSQGLVEQPPTSGRGSSPKNWRFYAARVGVEHPDDATRDQIIDAVRDAGHEIT